MARHLIEPPVAGARRLPMSYEEWPAWAAEAEFKSEWVDGAAIVFMPTTVRHALIAGFVRTLLLLYAEFLNLGQVLAETVEMRLAHAARVPDILFVARDHLDRLSERRLTGPADLVVEFVSDHSVERDRKDTFREFAAAGLAVAGSAARFAALPRRDRVRSGRPAAPPTPGTGDKGQANAPS